MKEASRYAACFAVQLFPIEAGMQTASRLSAREAGAAAVSRGLAPARATRPSTLASTLAQWQLRYTATGAQQVTCILNGLVLPTYIACTWLFNCSCMHRTELEGSQFYEEFTGIFSNHFVFSVVEFYF